MNFGEFLDPLMKALGEWVPTILGALAILVVGWLLALVIRVAVRKALGYLKLNQRLGTGAEKTIDFEGVFARSAYWLVLLLALVGGSPAAALMILILPHKINKGWFMMGFLAILIAQGAAIYTYWDQLPWP